MTDRPELTILALTDALAAFLKQRFGPGARVYRNPVHQALELPCWFISYTRLSGFREEIGGRGLRVFGVDLAWLDDYNLPGLYDRYLAAAEALDAGLGLLEYRYTVPAEGAEPEVRSLFLRPLDREWTVDPDAFHYKFKVKARVSVPPAAPREKMRQIESLNVSAKEGERHGA
jgi:hypothetical protein